MSEGERLKYLIRKAIDGEDYTPEDIAMARTMDSDYHFVTIIANIGRAEHGVEELIIEDFLDEVFQPEEF